MKLKVTPTQRETTFAPDEIIVSKTDRNGRITYANRVFMRLADLGEDDLLGVQHNIIRHPDMPRGVYRLMWNTIAAGREFFGYVKNMSAVGDHYWVFANVTPDFDNGQIVGYHSMRRCPPRPAVDHMARLYAEMKQIEASAGAAVAPDASVQWLETQLAAQHVSYEQFVLDLYGSGCGS